MNEHFKKREEFEEKKRPYKLEGFGGVESYLVGRLTSIVQEELEALAGNPNLSEYTPEQLADQVMKGLHNLADPQYRDSIAEKIASYRR